jgi:hypothetical protein
MGQATLRGLLLLLALAAGQVWAQSGLVIEIHGVVTEIGLGLGLPGAEVNNLRIRRPGPGAESLRHFPHGSSRRIPLFTPSVLVITWSKQKSSLMSRARTFWSLV